MRSPLKEAKLPAPFVNRDALSTCLRRDPDSGALEPEAVSEWLPAGAPASDDEAQLFYERLKPLVQKLVRAYLPRRESEEDLVQMVFIRIFSKFSQYSGAVPIVNWVSRIAINTCLSEIQREKARPEFRHADLSEEQCDWLRECMPDHSVPSPHNRVAIDDYCAQLLADLTPIDRLVLNLLHLEGFSVQDVGRLTGWSDSNVKIRAFRARAQVRKRFKAFEKSGDSKCLVF